MVIDPTFANLAIASAALGVAVLPIGAAAHAAFRRLGRRRNESDRCSRCGDEWTSDSAGIRDAHLVEGLLVCRKCTQTLRTRTRWALLGAVAFTVFTVVATGSLLISLHSQFGQWMHGIKLAILVFPTFAVTGLSARYVRRMKEENRLALEELGRARLLGGNVVAEPNAVTASTESHGA